MYMHQGNWKCSSCNGVITELPFMPRSESGLTCRMCYAQKKNGGGGVASDSSGQDEPTEFATSVEAPPIPDNAGLANEAPPADDFGGTATPATADRPKFSGDWKCAGCEGAITSLPFEPRDTSNLKCLDCFKKSRA